MQLFVTRPSKTLIVLSSLVLIASVILSISSYDQYYMIIAGKIYDELLRDGLTIPQAREIAQATGPNGALLIALGAFAPTTTCLLIIFGVMSRSTTAHFKRILAFLFFIIAALGTIILALGLTYFAEINSTISSQLPAAAGLYLFFIFVVWSAAGIYYLIRKNQKK